jgi:hypothetical protein
MNDQHMCVRQVLAHGCVANVERCSCGTLHLVMGPFTLRLTADQFRALFVTMLEAQSELGELGSEPLESRMSLANLLGQRAARGES